MVSAVLIPDKDALYQPPPYELSRILTLMGEDPDEYLYPPMSIELQEIMNKVYEGVDFTNDQMVIDLIHSEKNKNATEECIRKGLSFKRVKRSSVIEYN